MAVVAAKPSEEPKSDTTGQTNTITLRI